MRRTFAARLYRLAHQRPEMAWMDTEGLAALLAHFRQYPPSTWTLADFDDEAHALTGLARVLRDTRRALGRDA